MATTRAAISEATGELLLEHALQHVGEKYLLGILVPKDNPNWSGPWDCAEFASWLVFEVSGQLYGCDRDFGAPATADAYTGYWERDASTLGHIVAVEEAAGLAGAMVLRFPEAGATGHIVISDGTGGTVEAHSSKTGVIQSTLANRRWDAGVLVPTIQYSQAREVSVPPPASAIYRMTTPPMRGRSVRAIQQTLKFSGFDPGVIDGLFGPHTLAAVVAFQVSHQLVPDGEVGPATAAMLGIRV